MSDAKIVKLAETEVVSFGPLAHYQPIIGDDEGTTPVRTGIQTSQPGYVAPVHSHPYLEILHILDGTAEAWLEGREDEKVVLGKGDTIALPPGAPHSFRVVGDVPLRLLGTHVSPTRIVNYRDGGPTDDARLSDRAGDRRLAARSRTQKGPDARRRRTAAEAPCAFSLPCEAGGAEGQADAVALVVGDGRERGPHVGGGDAAEERQGLLHAIVHVHEGRRVEDGDERGEPLVDPVGAREVARPRPPRRARPGGRRPRCPCPRCSRRRRAGSSPSATS